MTADTGLRELATASLRSTCREWRLLLALYGVNTLVTIAAGFAVWLSFRVWLDRRPAPDLAGWALLLGSHPDGPFRVGLIALGACLFYGLLGAFLTGAVLERLNGGRSLRGALRLGPRLLLMRAMVGVFLALLLALGVLSIPTLYRLSLSFDDERWQALLALGIALLFGLPSLALLLVLHYGQAIASHRRSIWRSFRLGLALVHRRPLVVFALYAAAWLSWLIVTTASLRLGALGLVGSQLAALLRVAIHLWSYASAWELTASDVSAIYRGTGPPDVAPDPR